MPAFGVRRLDGAFGSRRVVTMIAGDFSAIAPHGLASKSSVKPPHSKENTLPYGLNVKP